MLVRRDRATRLWRWQGRQRVGNGNGHGKKPQCRAVAATMK
jgi:hypothetical protein